MAQIAGGKFGLMRIVNDMPPIKEPQNSIVLSDNSSPRHMSDRGLSFGSKSGRTINVSATTIIQSTNMFIPLIQSKGDEEITTGDDRKDLT